MLAVEEVRLGRADEELAACFRVGLGLGLRLGLGLGLGLGLTSG